MVYRSVPTPTFLCFFSAFKSDLICWLSIQKFTRQSKRVCHAMRLSVCRLLSG